MASFRDIKNESYFRFHYDNDYFTSTDRDYTQGYNFELALRRLKNNPINSLFLKPKNSEFKYGLSLEHIAYAPNNIKSPDIQYGDRPFAAAIMLKSFVITTDTIHKSRIVSSLSIGIIGPGAFGKEMQEGIHKATGNTQPQGWQNQIKNDVVLNYEIGYEKQLYRFGDFFAMQAGATLHAGTLFTNMSVGLNAVIGIINSPFETVKNRRKFRLYIYSQPLVTAIGYDATLQGGLFNRESPYTISVSAMKRFTAHTITALYCRQKDYILSILKAALHANSSPALLLNGVVYGLVFNFDAICKSLMLFSEIKKTPQYQSRRFSAKTKRLVQ